MAKLFVARNFQYKGRFIRAGELLEDATLTVPDQELIEEKRRGKHKKNGRWLSGLFAHCEPADESAEAIMGGAKLVAVKPPEDEVAAEEIRAEFDKIGKAYDRRWGTDRLETELIKAKKEVGA